MGTLSDVVNRLGVETTSGHVMERMQPNAAPVYALDALAKTLASLAETMKESEAREAPEAKEVDLKGVESALKALAKAMNVKVEPPVVNVAAPNVDVKAPVVNVAAPSVEVLMPDASMMRFDMYRDDRGLLKTVVATPVKEFEADDSFDID